MIKAITGPGSGIAAKLSKLPLLGRVARWMPRKLKGRGGCQAVIHSRPDLAMLPVLKCWPCDGGPFITLPLVHTVDPKTGSPNLGMYRMQVLDHTTTGMHWHMHKTGARHFRGYQESGRMMPVAVALGGDPVYTYCATAPLPDGIDEYLLAGFIRKKPVRLVKCITQDLWVPEDADIVIEGYVDPSEPLVMEGPFGDHTGFYSLEDLFPKFHATAITHAKKAAYPATIVGIPPQEDAWLAMATERIFEPLIKWSMTPELDHFHMPVAGVAHNLVLAAIRTDYPGQARKVFHTLLGAGQMMFTKFLVIAGKGQDLLDYEQLARLVSERVDPAVHIERACGPLDILDHAARQAAFGGKMGIDATGSAIFHEENHEVGPVDKEITALRSCHPEIIDHNLNWVTKGISLGLVSLTKVRPGMVRDLIDEIRLNPVLGKIRFWFFFDDFVDLGSPQDLTWLVGSNSDPAEDIIIAKSPGDQSHGILFCDATSKSFELDGFTRPWPNPTVMSKETIGMVDAKWKNYNLGNLLPSPSLRYLNYEKPGGASIRP
jgi:4-hydroxy-3-polyprenylbenzoate decarboxylase